MMRLLGTALVVSAIAGVLPTDAGAWRAQRNGGVGAQTLRGGPGPDHLSGGEGPDHLFGNGGGDLLTGDTGPDVAHGGAGADTITGAAGADHLSGDAGNDIASGGFGADTIDGGSGNDALEGGPDDDTISGGVGDDRIHGNSGTDTIDGGPGNDRIFADTGPDKILGGEGDDVIIVDATAATRVLCGSGDDVLYLTYPPQATEDYASITTAGKRGADCESIQATDAVRDPNQGITYLAPDTGGPKSGTSKDDTLLGGPGADRLRGGGGNDVLWGLRQAGLDSTLPDLLSGAAGDDTIYGGPGPQTISGGTGDDRLESGIGDGTISSGAGNDEIRLRGGGATSVDAGPGNDHVFARGTPRGRIRCGTGRDVVEADSSDRVARDCERVIGSARRRSTRRSARAAAGDPYADLILGTPDIAHYWRFSSIAAGNQTLDEVTREVQQVYPAGPLDGVTDDHTEAFFGGSSGFGFSTNASDGELYGPFTFETWVRPAAGDGTLRGLLIAPGAYNSGRGVLLYLELDGSLHGSIRTQGDPDNVEVRSAPLGLAAKTWHHLAWVRSATQTELWVDGARVAQAPAPEVTPDQTSSGWYVGGSGTTDGRPIAGWNGGLDEVALYHRALDGPAITAHARYGDDGVAPVTRLVRPVSPLQTPSVAIAVTTDKGGSSFACSLDGAAFGACDATQTLSGLADGPHELRILATDRLGVSEATPLSITFTVDATRPRTLLLVKSGVSGDDVALAAFGSDSATRFECRSQGVGEPAWNAFQESIAPFAPCTSPMTLRRGASFLVRAVDDVGNRDPTPPQIYIPVGAASAGTPLYPTFAGSRVEVLIEGEPPLPGRSPYQCRFDGQTWASCSKFFRLPIVHAGTHALEVRQALPGEASAQVATPPLLWTTAAGDSSAQIVGAAFPLVLERNATLARRVPRVRFALAARAQVRAQITAIAGRVVATIAITGDAGPNTLKIPARVLRSLKPGRYGLTITAQGSRAGPAVQRLPFAVVPAR